jgi:diguanylate cyclase (GGDEF)-like protein
MSEGAAMMSWEYWVILIESSIILLGAGIYFGNYWEHRKKRKSNEEYDELTGDLSRKAMLHLGQQVLENALRNGVQLSVAMLDIDDFSQINQQLGPPQGDTVLKQMAELLRHQLRQADKISRWRGEGWLILMPESGAAMGKKVFERLQHALAEHAFSLPQHWHLSVSMGVAELKDSDESFDDLIKRANTALIKAKQSGKNSLSIYSD